MYGIAFQTVGECAVDGVALDAVAAEDEGIAINQAEDIGRAVFCRYIFNVRKTVLPIEVSTATLGFVEDFDAVLMVPVAGDNHLPAVEFQG